MKRSHPGDRAAPGTGRALLAASAAGVFLLFLLGPSPAAHSQGETDLHTSFSDASFSSLSELTDAFSLAVRKETASRKVHVEKGAIREMHTGEVCNLSAYLQNELEASLSRRGFVLVQDAADADFLVGVAYRRGGDRVRVFFRCHQGDGTSRDSRAYEIPEKHLPRDAFAQTVEGKIARLVEDLSASRFEGRVYLKPLREGRQGYVSPFSRAFTALLRTEMVRVWRGVELIDEKPVLQELSRSRGIVRKARAVEDLGTWEAACTDADAVLDGIYFAEKDAVTVTLDLKSLKGRLLGSAKSHIPRTLIHADLEDPQAARLTGLAGPAPREHASGVRILTGLGGDFPVYVEGETIELFVQVREPLYVYVYNINARGEVTRLYPAHAPAGEVPFQPGRLCPLSGEASPFAYMAAQPFGMDLVKVFASTLPLPLPSLSTPATAKAGGGSPGLAPTAATGAVHAGALTAWYQKVAAGKGARLHEDQVLLETRGRGPGK